MKGVRSVFLLLAILAFCRCSVDENGDMDQLFVLYGNDSQDISSALEEFAGMRIYFGHQSVGYNIVEGIETLSSETGISVNTVGWRDFGETGEPPAFIEFGIGRNEEPYLKIDDFAQVVKENAMDKGAFALFKFCYVDFYENADVDAIFTYYKEKMYSLQEQYPDIRIALCTVPYEALQKGVKAVVKKAISRPLAGELENPVRYEFNQRILNEMGQDFPVFDLGRIESTEPDGTLCTYQMDGKTYPAMTRLYATEDRGHLNELGSRTVAYNFISFFSELSGK